TGPSTYHAPVTGARSGQPTRACPPSVGRRRPCALLAILRRVRGDPDGRRAIQVHGSWEKDGGLYARGRAEGQVSRFVFLGGATTAVAARKTCGRENGTRTRPRKGPARGLPEAGSPRLRRA